MAQDPSPKEIPDEKNVDEKNADEESKELNNNDNNDSKENKKESEEPSFLHLTCSKVYEIDPPIEVSQKITDDDISITKQLKEKYGELTLNELYPDVVIRFVRGYAHEKERFKATCDRFDNYFKKSKDYNFPNILNEKFEEEDECFKAWPIYIYGEDKQGHVILYDEIGSANPATISKVFEDKTERLKVFRYRFMKRLSNAKRGQSQKYKQLIYKHIMVMDMSGFSAGHFGAKHRNLVQEVIGEEQHLFPETLYKLYIINAPWPFRVVWKIISNFIDPITYKKISVLGDNYLPEMLKEINKDQIPTKYGGTGQWDIRSGDVPVYDKK